MIVLIYHIMYLYDYVSICMNILPILYNYNFLNILTLEMLIEMLNKKINKPLFF